MEQINFFSFPQIQTSLISFPTLVGFLIVIAFFFLFSDKILTILERTWENFSEDFYEPAEESSDPMDSFSDFISLDQDVFQVITDTKTKFEDVAGNEEAKEEERAAKEALICAQPSPATLASTLGKALD
jgi:ATP-dependent Zn protease